MKVKIIRQSDCNKLLWTGGTTTQLYIFPENSSYQERNFIFRISTATVEAEESTFTHLPAYNRFLMILDGQIEINHRHHYTKILGKFDIDAFDGAWETSAKGKVTDFNLMYLRDIQANLEYLSINAFNEKEFIVNCNFNIIYTIKNNIKIFINNQEYHLNEKELLIIECDNIELNFKVLSDVKVDLIYCQIYL